VRIENAQQAGVQPDEVMYNNDSQAANMVKPGQIVTVKVPATKGKPGETFSVRKCPLPTVPISTCPQSKRLLEKHVYSRPANLWHRDGSGRKTLDTVKQFYQEGYGE